MMYRLVPLIACIAGKKKVAEATYKVEPLNEESILQPMIEGHKILNARL